MNDYATVNKIYAEYFPSKCPARSCVAVVGLPRDALVEVEATAVINEA